VDSIILFLIENIYIGLGVLFIGYVILSFFILSQKESIVRGRDEIYMSMNKVYQKKTKTLKVLAGEANKNVYIKLCELIEQKFDEGTLQKVIFAVGPTISIFSEDMKYIDSNGKFNNQIDSIIELHPIFKLYQKYNQQVEIYYKKNNEYINDSHFVITDNILYVEKPHQPLEETDAVIINNPNPFLKYKYQRKIKNLLNKNDLIKINSIQDLTNIKFYDFPKAA